MQRAIVVCLVIAAGCASAPPPTAAVPARGGPASTLIERWVELARGEDELVVDLASEWVAANVRDPRIASLDPSGTDVASGAPRIALVTAQIDLVASVLALGLAHAHDETLVALGRRLEALDPIHDDAGFVTVLDALGEVADDPRSHAAVERLPETWPEGSSRRPSRDELGRAAVWLALRWLGLWDDPRMRGVDRSGVCISGNPWAFYVWTPASTVAFAIGMGAEPRVVLDLVHDRLVAMIALARSLPAPPDDGVTADVPVEVSLH
ncbi:hypothetical protein [Sandaracinus amylolyticus]|uniref:Uncharacterized protein n=1 Tax=Sandaracinus amylolyticus TaxID=927083 RepID=A0A0F6YMF1_9BACT|nr:hypothetical protein [Sandaracinus amylolyticus]AKF10976.1 hypothetical protein DB32_008125 [Sandaracinus amylolyticus]